MTTYPDIEIRIREISDKMGRLAFMTKEEIFELIAEVVAISDLLNNMIRDIDIKISEKGAKITASIIANEQKLNASMVDILIKQQTAELKADKEWADRQAKLLSEIRMAALAAQRSAE